MQVINCDQQSPEWHAARLGIPTSSHFHEIVQSDGTPSKSRKGYLYQLAAERISGRYDATYSSSAMQGGIDREEESRLVYAMLHEVEVTQVGFCVADNGRWGCSVDGLVGSDGIVELKNRKGKATVEHLLATKLPVACVQQVQGQLFVTDRAWCDYASYYPGLPMLVVRVEPDRHFITCLEKELITFCEELDTICADIKGEAS